MCGLCHVAVLLLGGKIPINERVEPAHSHFIEILEFTNGFAGNMLLDVKPSTVNVRSFYWGDR